MSRMADEGGLVRRLLLEGVRRARVMAKRALLGRPPGDRLRQLIDAGVVSIGPHTYGRPEVHYFPEHDRCKVIIGAYCSIAVDVVIIPGGIHPVNWVSTYPFKIKWDLPGRADDFPSSKGNVVIGNDVWIAEQVLILSGVQIGHGAVIGAGSVVVGRVPPYAIYGGNPAQLLRYRFSEEQIAKLLAIRWWDWDEAKLRDAVPLLSSANIDAFLVRYASGPLAAEAPE